MLLNLLISYYVLKELKFNLNCNKNARFGRSSNIANFALYEKTRMKSLTFDTWAGIYNIHTVKTADHCSFLI